MSSFHANPSRDWGAGGTATAGLVTDQNESATRERWGRPIEEAIEEAVKPLREELTALKETVTTWTVQGRLVRTISHPISGIVVAIITALIVSYLTK
mgnify:CR=1 FL=1